MTNEEHRKVFERIESTILGLEELYERMSRKPKPPSLPICYLEPMGMHEQMEGRWIWDENGNKRPL